MTDSSKMQLESNTSSSSSCCSGIQNSAHNNKQDVTNRDNNNNKKQGMSLFPTLSISKESIIQNNNMINKALLLEPSSLSFLSSPIFNSGISASSLVSSSAPSSSFRATAVTNPNKKRHHEMTIEMKPLQSNFLNDTMKQIRQEEDTKRERRKEDVRKMNRDRGVKRQRMMMMVQQHQQIQLQEQLQEHQQQQQEEILSTQSNENDHHGSEASSSVASNDGTTTSNSETSASTADIRHSNMSILEELNVHPNVAQIVATPGGLVVCWNDEFINLTATKKSSSKVTSTSTKAASHSSSSSTIFELIDPKSLPNLYGMLALALHDVGIMESESVHFNPSSGGKEETSSSSSFSSELSKSSNSMNGGKCKSSSHLSITLPCKPFRESLIRYNITIIFMDDLVPMKRCFLGILTPILSSPPSPSHISRSTSQDSTENIDGNFESKQDKDHAAQIMRNKLQLPCDRIFRLGDDMLNQFLLGPK